MPLPVLAQGVGRDGGGRRRGGRCGRCGHRWLRASGWGWRAGLLTAAGDVLARPAGQTSARWQVLAAVEDAPATVADVARALGLARQSVQREADLRRAGAVLARALDAVGAPPDDGD